MTGFINVKGCISIDDNHVVIFGGTRSYKIETIRQICYQALPELAGPEISSWEDKNTDLTELPPHFIKKAKDTDACVDWEKTPCVAIALNGGVFVLTKLSVD